MEYSSKWIRPTESESKLYQKHYGKNLTFSPSVLKFAKSLKLVKSQKSNVIGDIVFSENSQFSFLEEVAANKKSGKVFNNLKLKIDENLFSLSSVLAEFQCEKCFTQKNVHLHPSRDLTTFNSLMCEKCYKSEFYKTEEYQDKIKSTMLEKYGETSPIRVPEIKKRIAKTMIERYGVPYSAMNDELRQKSVQTTREKYGASMLFGSSFIELEFGEDLKEICEKLGLCVIRSSQWQKSIKIDNRVIIPDFFIEEISLCVEFFGDYFHGNPEIYSANQLIGFKRETREERNLKDEERILKLKEAGIDTIVIWENSYKKRKDETLKCLKDEIENAKRNSNTLTP